MTESPAILRLRRRNAWRAAQQELCSQNAPCGDKYIHRELSTSEAAQRYARKHPLACIHGLYYILPCSRCKRSQSDADKNTETLLKNNSAKSQIE